MKPNIYECKICQEHHCEHDFPEESAQELAPIFNHPPIVLQPPPKKLNLSPKPDRGQDKSVSASSNCNDKPSSSKDLNGSKK